jgi:hypothetical protein
MARNTVAGAVGLRAVYVGVRADDGTFSIPATVTPGDAYYGIKAHKSKALTITLPDPQSIPLSGDDSVWATFLEAPTDSPSGELRTQVLDTSLTAMLSAVLEVSSGYRTEVALATDKQGSESPLIIWGVRQAKSGNPEESTFGSDLWESIFILNAYASAKPGGYEESQPGEMAWNIVSNKSTLDLLGKTLTAVTNGCTEACMQVFHTTYKPFYEVFEGDGALSTFTLTQGANVIHDDSNSPITCTIDGTERAVTVDASGVMTVSGAVPADSAKIAVFYEYND